MAKNLRRWLDKAGLFPLAERFYLVYIRVIRFWSDGVVLPLIAHSGMLRKIHFFLFSSVFDHEMEMYVKARLNYLKQNRGAEGNPFLLRRNIHRIEKGLMMENRRDLFALDYIIDTVEVYEKIRVANQSVYIGLLQWASDVLSAYFQRVKSHPVTDRARAIFERSGRCREGCTLEFVPYGYRPLSDDAAEEMSEMFVRLVHQRKSVRRYRFDLLPQRDKIERAVLLASQAPSSCNRQPFEFRIYDNPVLVQKLSELPSGAGSFRESIPLLAVVVGKMEVSPSPGDRHLMYIDGSLAAMNFMLALESMGISSCPINWPDNKHTESKMRRIISLKDTERPVLLISIGYAHPDAAVAHSERKGLGELCNYNI
jgi:nitroreductase